VSAPLAGASESAAAASAPKAAASAEATPAPVAKPRPAPIVQAEPSFLDSLLDNPLIPAGAGAALLALVGLGAYRFRQRRKSAQVDSSFLESRLQPDSFFGASGGQRIDTNEGTPTGSSMVYSPSQLDAAGDVDPVAEADVYLAYGRDLQAEEILKEALRVNPQRVAIHAKLLEIYAKRRDTRAFEVIAAEAHRITHGEGTDWHHICQLGQELDPANSMYRPGGQPGEHVPSVAASTVPGTFGSTTATPVMPQAAAAGPDLDLDLDFSIGDEAPAPVAAAPVAPAPLAEASAEQETPPANLNATQPLAALDLDFGMGGAPAAAPASEPEPARLDAPDLTLDEHSLNFDIPAAPAPAPAAAAPAPAADGGMIEFDLGALSFDAPSSGTSAAAPAELPADMPSLDLDDIASTGGLSTGGFDAASSDDPLATKLALAQEFNAIGDPDGARSLAQEVIAEASGELKARAQRFLAEIG
jgi:pilus assembly protein FimV